MTLRARTLLRGRVDLELRGPAAPMTIVPPPPPWLAGPAARPIVLEPLSGAPRQAIAARVGKTEVWFVMDDSGSMYASWGDPTGIRYAAAQSLLALMRRAGGGRAGVVHWGSTAPAALAIGPLDVRRRRKPLNDSLAVPGATLGGNDLPAALQRAAERIGRLPEDETLLVLPITDGIEDVTAATHAAVAALPPRCVHLLLVDRASQCDARMEAAWRSVAFGSFTRLETFNTRTMAYQLAGVLANALDLDAPEPA